MQLVGLIAENVWHWSGKDDWFVFKVVWVGLCANKSRR